MFTSRNANFERTSSNISYLSINQPTIFPSIYQIYISISIYSTIYPSIYTIPIYQSIFPSIYLSIFPGELLDLPVLCLPLHGRGLSETSYTTPRYKIRFIEIQGDFSSGGREIRCVEKFLWIFLCKFSKIWHCFELTF